MQQILSQNKKSNNYNALLLLSIIWGLGLFFIRPLGDFPLNDDWVYGLATKYFYEKKEFYPIPWSATSLLSNVIWGWGFVEMFGFSFNILRLSSLVAALLGSFSTYYLLFNISKSKVISFLAALALLGNPLFFGLSYTYMTDVFCLTAIIMSLIFYLELFKNKFNVLNFFGATLFSVIAVLSRQTSLIIPLAYILTFFILNDRQKFSTQVLKASFPFLITLLAFLLMEYFLKTHNRLPAMSLNGLTNFFDYFLHPLTLIFHLPRKVVPILFYIGLFSLPVLALIPLQKLNFNKKNFVVILIALTLFNGLRLMPTANNIIAKYGMGPITTRDVYFLGINKPQEISNYFWLFVTICSLFGATLLVYLTPEIFKRMKGLNLFKKKIVVFLLLIIIGYISFFLVFPIWDRYLLIFIPLVWLVLYLFFLNRKIPVKRLIISLLISIIFLIYSAVTTKDYFNFNLVRWKLLNFLISEEYANTKDIDGGYEYNGLYNYDRFLNSSNWWVINDEYLISLGSMNGYFVYKELHYHHILPNYTQSVYLLKKSN